MRGARKRELRIAGGVPVRGERDKGALPPSQSARSEQAMLENAW